MTRLCFLCLNFLLSTIILKAQTDFSRYLDERSVPIFDIDRHLEVKFDWTMGGKVQMHMNEGLNYIQEGNLDLAMTNLDEVLKVDSLFWPARYYKGVVFTKRSKLQEARKEFEHAVRINPKKPEPYVEIGRILERETKYKQAKSFYEKAIATDSKFVPGHFGLATMELFMGEAKKALRVYEHCIEIDSSYAEAYVVLSILKFRDKKKNNESIALLNRAVRANPKYTHTYFWRGYLHVMLGAPEKALVDWTSYINSKPGDPFILSMRGFLYIELNRFDEAFTDLRKAFLSRTIDEEAFKGAQTLLDKQIDLYAATQYLLRTGYGLKENTFSHVKKGYCLLLAGRSKAGLEELQKAKNMERAAIVFLLEGIANEHVNDHPSAYYSYDNALKLDNDIFDAHKKRCIYRMELKDWAGVDEDIREMTRLIPESLIIYRLRGFAKGNRRDFAGCVSDLAKYIARDSSDVEVLRSLSVCRAASGDEKGANENLRQILDIEPENWSLLEDVAQNYLALGDTSKAITLLSRYARERPGIFIPFIEIARIQIARKQWDIAKHKIDTALRLLRTEALDIQHSEALYLKGEIEFSQGFFKTVVDICSDALKLNKNNDHARYLRARSYHITGDTKKALADLKALNEKGFQPARPLYDKLSKGTQ